MDKLTLFFIARSHKRIFSPTTEKISGSGYNRRESEEM
jgi:hypothetical protein